MAKKGEAQQLRDAKRGYREAESEGNRAEEARWANVIGDILKNRGEYVEALKWLRKDYDVSTKYLPEKQILPTCQTLGELYLRLQDFKHALTYQKRHLELAKDTNDLIEQQRASTQLGRTYHEMFLRSDDDHLSVRNAKKYFKAAMKLAEDLKKNPSSARFSFVKEYIDAHNNLGMLEMDLDNLEEAQKILTRGLEICDEEEVIENDDARSRLHHNLGNVYMEIRKWKDASKHIEKDIKICRTIHHLQGEAKGYINLGELHYRVQKYDEAIHCYQKALELAKSMEDEDALVRQIEQNITTVKEAVKVMGDIMKEEQHLKKLSRNMEKARGTAGERKCLLGQMSSLDRLIEKSSMIFAWKKHCEYAKKKREIADELCDKEKLGDSFLAIGESYQKLRDFKQALKWYTESWKTYKLIGNLEGQALAKIDIGDVLDSDGDWEGAFSAFEEGYRIALQAKLPSVQLSALENMHYSQMIRFDNVEEARRLQSLIDQLKVPARQETESQDVAENCCSETETEIDDQSLNISNISKSSGRRMSYSPQSKSQGSADDSNENCPLISLFHPSKKLKTKLQTSHRADVNTSMKLPNSSSRSTSMSAGSQSAGRKRLRLVLSDEECEHDQKYIMETGAYECHIEEVATSNEFKHAKNFCSAAHEFQQHILVKIDDDLVHVNPDLCMVGSKLNIDRMKVEVACLYYLILPSEKREKGLVPVIQHIKYDGQLLGALEEFDKFKDLGCGRCYVEASIHPVWELKPVMNLYIDYCKELSEQPNLKVLKKLYVLEVSGDEIIVSDCELQDISAAPLLSAMVALKTVAVIDLSHNMLGNETMKRLQQVFMASGQTYGGLLLDLHCNRLGPSALFQISECPVLYTRLEVLNVSGNRLTDACASYISTILKNCKALYTLNIEQCSMTSRTIQKIADSLDAESVLEHLWIGHNGPISANAITGLMQRIATLTRFQELSLSGIRLSKPMVDSLCQLAKSANLSGLILGSTGIGTDGAVQITDSLSIETQELVKLDLSSCGLTSEYFTKVNIGTPSINGILELNLGGNPILQQGADVLMSFLKNTLDSLRVLVLCKCQLGLAGIIQVLKILSENCSLEELNLAGNVNLDESHNSHISAKESSSPISGNPLLPETLLKTSATKEIESCEQELCERNKEDDLLQVADSDEKTVKEEVTGSNDSSMALSQKIQVGPENGIFQELLAAIKSAKHLQLLDLSDNGFSNHFLELCTAWSSGARAGLSRSHIQDNLVHLSVPGYQCCGRKPCCRRI